MQIFQHFSGIISKYFINIILLINIVSSVMLANFIKIQLSVPGMSIFEKKRNPKIQYGVFEKC